MPGLSLMGLKTTMRPAHRCLSHLREDVVSKETVKKEDQPTQEDPGFQVGSTIELDVPSQKDQDDQLGLF